MPLSLPISPSSRSPAIYIDQRLRNRGVPNFLLRLDGARNLSIIGSAVPILMYFNRGVLTGDWDGPHVPRIGGYDQGAHQAAIMDVDRE
jgi:hypothetical protein